MTSGSSSTSAAAVIIPAHNHASFIEEAVRSAVAQGEGVQEIIVVDDGSTDQTASVVGRLSDPRVRLIGQAQRGPSAARNVGWRASQARWVQFLDADDRLATAAIDRLIAAGNRDPSRIPFGIEAIYPEVMSEPPAFTAQLSSQCGHLLDEIATWYHGTIFTALIPREALEQMDGLDEQVRFGEDYDLAIRLAQRYEFTFVPSITYHARMHGTNRHREFGAAAQAQYLGTIARTLGSQPGLEAHWRYRRARAHWLWKFGCQELERGRVVAARGFFLRACFSQPLKLRAWLGWVQSWRPGAGSKPRAVR